MAKHRRPRETNPFDDVEQVESTLDPHGIPLEFHLSDAAPTPGKVYKGEPYSREEFERDSKGQTGDDLADATKAGEIIPTGTNSTAGYNSDPEILVAKQEQWEPNWDGLKIGQTFPPWPAPPAVSVTDMQVIKGLQVVFYMSYTGPAGRLPLADFLRRYR